MVDMTPIDSPYEPPVSSDPPTAAAINGSPPAVWPYYISYCLFMALMYVGCTVGGLWFFFNADFIASGDPTTDPLEMKILGGLLTGVGLPFMLFYGIAPLLPKNRVGWIVGVIGIGFGLTSACCMLAAIPLLIYWINEDTRRFFGMGKT